MYPSRRKPPMFSRLKLTAPCSRPNGCPASRYGPLIRQAREICPLFLFPTYEKRDCHEKNRRAYLAGRGLVFVPSGFYLIEVLHEGKKSCVSRVHAGDNTPVILKTTSHDYPEEGDLQRLRHEFDLATGFDSPLICNYRDIFFQDGMGYIIKEDHGDVSFAKAMPLLGANPKQFLDVALNLARCVQVVHDQGLIHRDLKPSNFLFNPQSGNIKLSDFGIAVSLPRDSSLYADEIQPLGTPAYMAPEQTGRMKRPLDFRTDLYALGMIYYELLLGNRPFDGRDMLDWMFQHLACLPEAPHTQNAKIPKILSDLVLKLLEKNPIERYQSVDGLIEDLSALNALPQDEWDEFVIGRHDFSPLFQLPAVMVGRERERTILFEELENIRAGGRSLTLVLGPVGQGKNRLIEELRDQVFRLGGVFASGRFHAEQQRDLGPILSVLNELARRMLKLPEDRLNLWRERLKEALGDNLGLLTGLAGGMEQALGEYPAPQGVSAEEAVHRLHWTLSRTLSLFARDDLPFVIYMGEMQWADEASVALINYMISQMPTPHLMLVFSMRNDILSPGHHVSRMFSELTQKGEEPLRLEVAPFSQEEVGVYLAAALRIDVKEVDALAETVHGKTRGSPLHLSTMLRGLNRQGKIVPYPNRPGSFQLAEEAVREMEIGDDLARLISGEVAQVPESGLDILMDGLSLGSGFTLDQLADFRKQDREDLNKRLEKALGRGLLNLYGEQFRVAHERIQEAVEHLFSDAQRTERLLKAGRWYLQQVRPGKAELSQAVDRLNHARALIHDAKERRELAALNLRVGRHALEALSCGDALAYLEMGLNLLGERTDEPLSNLHQDLLEEAVRAAMGTGAMNKAGYWTEILLADARDRHGLINHGMNRVVQLTLEGNYEAALGRGAEGLKLLGEPWPDQAEAAIEAEIQHIDKLLAGRDLDVLLEMSPCEDVRQNQLMAFLDILIAPAYFVAPAMLPWLGARMIRTVLTHGIHETTAHACAVMALYRGPICGDYKTAFRFGALSMAIQNRTGHTDIKNTLIFADNIAHFILPLWEIRLLNEESIQTGMRNGSMQYTGYFRMFEMYAPFFQGVQLNGLKEQVPGALAFMRDTGNLAMVDSIDGFDLCIDALLNASDETDYLLEDRESFLERCNEDGSFLAVAQFHVLHTFVCFLGGRWRQGLQSAHKAHELAPYTLGHFSVVEVYFYQALCASSLYLETGEHALLAEVDLCVEKFREPAKNCAYNFKGRLKLMMAAQSWMRGDTEQTWRLFDDAVESLHETHFLHYEAVANELTARFWLQQGKQSFGRLYFERARALYKRWGVLSKEDELQELISSLDPNGGLEHTLTQTTVTTTDGRESENLDMETIIRAAQGLSGTVDLSACLGKIINIMLENAGARRGVVILERQGELQVAAWGNLNSVTVGRPLPLKRFDALPHSVIFYVQRTEQDVILHEEDNAFADDPYLHRKRPRSLLCTPLRNMKRVKGCLYLENSIANNAFSPARLRTLQVLLAQAAISIDNAWLVEDMTRLNQILRREIEERKRVEAEILDLNRRLEERVAERTSELENTQRELVEQARRAGMADIATSVLHNVGNILNSVIVSGHNMEQDVDGINLANLSQAATALEAMATRLPDRGKRDDMLVAYYKAWPDKLRTSLGSVRQGVERIQDKIQVIRHVVEAQQTYASAGSQTELHRLDEIVRDASYIVQPMLEKDRINLEIEGDAPLPIPMQKVKMIHILVNLIKNAREAVRAAQPEEGLIQVCYQQNPEITTLSIRDNGVGIPKEDLAKIFSHGFTTKKEGHGFGLHSCANIMAEMGGRIWADAGSKGAVFNLELPTT